MNSEKRILTAFWLNTVFAAIELVGGLLCGSVAIVSDAMHDAGDALSIGVAWLFEKKSRRPPDGRYTYGYGRYSLIGGLITAAVLAVSALAIIVGAIGRLVEPTAIRYDGMIALAVVGLVVNAAAVAITHNGDSHNQKAVSLHMLEDVLGWAVVLVGAVVMRWTGCTWLDPLMSVGMSVFVLCRAVGMLAEVTALLAQRTPRGVSAAAVADRLGELDGVREVHHLHLWSLDGQHHCATVHIVIDGDPPVVKESVRRELQRQGVECVTIETEAVTERCGASACRTEQAVMPHSCHC